MHKLVPHKEAAELLGIAPRTLYTWIKEGTFPKPVHLGRKAYFEREVVTRFIDEQVERAATT